MAGRPREFDREAALSKARDIFWSRGYEGTSMADLVAALGIASARIYAAFGSKEELFREAISLYETHEGGFADRAFEEEPTTRRAIERMLRDAVETYTRRGRPQGCMVVSAATNCSTDNETIGAWLAEHRRERTASIIDRLKQGVASGELPENTDAQAWGDLFATLLHGLSVQARDGVPKKRLHALISQAMQALERAAG
ncbi:MAG: TetR/AcrR family transcriptional regulator [Steroidobacteraceae bacterium]